MATNHKSYSCESLKNKPGSCLKFILASLGFNPRQDCGCEELAAYMDAIGPRGCRNNREYLVSRLRQSYQNIPWLDTPGIILRAAYKGLLIHIDPLDVPGSLLDYAVKLSDQETSEPSEKQRSSFASILSGRRTGYSVPAPAPNPAAPSDAASFPVREPARASLPDPSPDAP